MHFLRTNAQPAAAAVAAIPGRLAGLFSRTTRAAAPLCQAPPPARALSTTPAAAAKPMPEGGYRTGVGPQYGNKLARAKRMAHERDPKIKVLDKMLYKMQFIPPPLRMARNRYLRHWTIHRAWLMFRRKEREQRERELMQQYQSMHNACEELRLSRGPGLRNEGYLYRVAMEKKGVYRHGGFPIEAGRPLTETPATTPWEHDWTR